MMYSTHEQIKVAQSNHKAALKNRESYNKKRDALVNQMLTGKIPRWGGARIDIVKW